MALPLGRQIILLNLAILMPAAGMIAWSTSRTYQEQLQQLREEAGAMAATVVDVLERGLDLRALQTVLTEIPLPAQSVITVTDERATILARSADPEQHLGQSVDLHPLPIQQVPRFVQRTGVDGVERVFVNSIFQQSPGPWLVSVGIPVSVAYARVAPILQRQVLLAVGVALFTLALELWLLRSYTRAFRRAITYSNRVTAGDLTPPPSVPMPSRELEHLQHAVITMVTNMRSAREEIAAQVVEERRTRQEVQSLQQQVIRQERLAAIGVLASGVAHEMNNPLQAIVGFTELLQLRPDMPADAQRDLDLILKESTRASAIVRNLSTFSRQHTAEPSRVRIADVVASVVELRQRRLAQHDIHLHVVQEADTVVLAVFTELQQVLLNFLVNAEQAFGAQGRGGKVSIRTSLRKTCARVEVEDDGPGVPLADEAKLFQPFFTTKPVGEGTGLGLSVSYGIIHSHGGTIGYQRGALGGAQFYFELPLAA